MNQPSDADRIVATLSKVVRRRKRVVAAGLAAALIPVLVLNAVQTPLYEATTSIVFDEVATPVPATTEDLSREILLSNRLEELASRSFALDIAAGLGADDRRRFQLPIALPSGSDSVAAMADRIQASLLASPVRNSNVVRIAVRLNDAKLAATVANSGARVFQERNDRIRREGAGGVRRFIEQQLERTRSELDTAEEALRAYKQSHHITAFDSEAQEVLRRTTEAEVLYNESHASRGAAEEKLAAVQATLARQKQELVPSVTESGSPTVVRLRDRLGELQSEHVELELQGYPPTHPKMAQLADAIEQTKRNLTDEVAKLIQGNGVADPLAQMQKYAGDATALQIEIESSKAQEKALGRVIAGYDDQLAQLPEKEYQLARLTRERDVANKVYTMLLEKLEESRIAEAEKLPNIRILDSAQVPLEPVRPRKALNLALGTVLGLLLGTGLGFGVELRRAGVDSELELHQQTGWMVLGTVPRMIRGSSKALAKFDGANNTLQNRNLWRGLIAHLEPDSAPAEAYRMLRTHLQFRGAGTSRRTLLVTSVGPGEGKSTTVANLGISLAAAGHRVVLVDGEVRRPVLHSVFGVPRAPGLTDALMTVNGLGPPREAPGGLRDFVRPTHVERLHILPAGVPVENRGDRLATALPAVEAILAALSEEYDFVLVDAPPLLLVHDAALLARSMDGVLFVVSALWARPELLERARELLDTAGAQVLGAVLNSADPARVHGYGAYYSDLK